MSRLGKGYRYIIILCTIILILSLLASPGYCIPLHEDPDKVVSISQEKDEIKLQNNLQDLVYGAVTIAYYVNISDYSTSDAYMKNFEDQLYNYKQQLEYSQISDSVYNRLGQSMVKMNDDLLTITRGSRNFQDEYNNFSRYQLAGDPVNATKSAVNARDIYRNLCKANVSYASNSATATRLLNDTAIYTDPLDYSAKLINNTLEKISANMIGIDELLSRTVLKLWTDRDSVNAGDTITFYVSLKTDSRVPVEGQKVALYINNRYAGENYLSSNGSCGIAYLTGDLNRSLTAQARLMPNSPGLVPAVSDLLPITVLEKGTVISINIAPSTVTYGDTIQVSGTLAGADGSKVANRTVDVSLNNGAVGSVKTDNYGSYVLSIPVTHDTPGGSRVFRAKYTRPDNSGDVYASSRSASGNVYVTVEGTRLTLDSPNSSLIGGDIAAFSGTLVTEDGLPVRNAAVGIYDGNRQLGQNTTDDNGAYRAIITMPYDIGTGNHQLYSAFKVNNRSVNSSTSNNLSISFGEVAPYLTGNRVSTILFDGDLLYLHGALLSKNDMPLAGQQILIQLSNTTIVTLKTDTKGRYEYRHKITYQDPAGHYDVSVVAPDCVYEAGSMYVLPYNKIAIVLAAIIIPLTILYIIIKILGVDRLILIRLSRMAARAARNRRTRATPAPAIPETPAPVSKLEMKEEIAALKVMIGDGRLKDALIGVYALSRQVARHYGNAVEDSSTHREFYWDMALKYAAASRPLGDIVNKYEVVNYGRGELSSSDVAATVDDLCDLYRTIESHDKEESRL